MRIGVVGAGVIGRLLTWQLAKQGHVISLFDSDFIQRYLENGHSAGYTAAGMISPLSEADSAEPQIVTLGLQALKLWPSIIADIGGDVDFHQQGSLILAHPPDRSDLINFRRHVSRYYDQYSEWKQAFIDLDHNQLKMIEPDLAEKFCESTFIANEAWLSPQKLLSLLAQQLLECGVVFHEKTEVVSVESFQLTTETKTYEFDWVIDCRGMGAKKDFLQLRGVRGEIILLHAPDVDIKHLIRLMHPRYRLYIVPRANHHYVIGATQIESDSMASITVRSALELLSAAYSVHPGFGEAHIIHTRVNCRPALPNNLPTIIHRQGLMRINGLFRHGVLLVPAIAHEAVYLLQHRQPSNFALQQGLVHQNESTLVHG